MKMSPHMKAYLSISFVNVLWGLSFIASKSALSSGFHPFSLAATRFVIAAVLLMPLSLKKNGVPRFTFKIFMLLALSAILGITIYFLCEYRGLELTSASTASLIIAAIPSVTLLVGVFVHKKRFAKICYLGVITSLLGVYLIVSFGQSDGTDSLTGVLYILAAVVCWVAYIEVTDLLLKTFNSLDITAWQALVGAVTLLPLMATEKTDWATITPTGWAMALYLAILCSVVAYVLYVRTIKELEPLKTALFINLNPLAAVLGGVLLLGETLTPMQLLGGAVVLISIFMVNWNPASARHKGGKPA